MKYLLLISDFPSKGLPEIPIYESLITKEIEFVGSTSSTSNLNMRLEFSKVLLIQDSQFPTTKTLYNDALFKKPLQVFSQPKPIVFGD